MSLDDLYARVPSLPQCDGRCWASCGPLYDLHGRPAFGDAEAARILRRMRGLPEPREGDGMCSLLNVFGRCDVYSDRPMICRLWGATERMPCPFGCEPEGGLLDAEEGRFLLRAALVASR